VRVQGRVQGRGPIQGTSVGRASSSRVRGARENEATAVYNEAEGHLQRGRQGRLLQQGRESRAFNNNNNNNNNNNKAASRAFNNNNKAASRAFNDNNKAARAGPSTTTTTTTRPRVGPSTTTTRPRAFDDNKAAGLRLQATRKH
jgi:hypothetical protein